MRQAISYAVGLSVLSFAMTQAKAPSSEGYRVWVEMERVDSLHWEATVGLENAGPIVAMTLPFKWGSGRSPYNLDSANYAGLRTEYFALKTFRVDSTKQSVLIGLIADLGGNSPPLEPGSGTITRLYFTSRRASSPVPILDTTFVLPHNTLQLVTPDVRAIKPKFERGDQPATAPR